jgi:eukaryotic-like serine/threonine-protein kinase
LPSLVIGWRAMGRSFLHLVLVALVTAGTYLIMYFYVTPRLPATTADVPSLAGLTVEQARGILEPRGLVLVLDGEKSSDRAAPGTLTHQAPLVGSRLRHGGEVHAFVATAAPPKVPKLVGMTVAEAQNELGDVRLKPGKVSEGPSDTVLKGQVIASLPSEGTALRPDALVDLLVSSGPSAPSTATVPQVVGKRLTKAKELLEQAGFDVGATRYGSNDDYDQGVVIKQSPSANAPAARGAKVDLVIND